MPLRKKPTHTTLLGIVFLLLSILQATEINATKRKDIPEFYRIFYTIENQKPAKGTYNNAQQKGILQGPVYLASRETSWHLREYHPAIPQKHYITLYTATGTILNPYVNPYNGINDPCNYNDVQDIKQLVIKYAINYKPERPSTLIGKEVYINVKKIRYCQDHQEHPDYKELLTDLRHPLDYQVAKKRNRHKPDVLAIGYVNLLAKGYNMHVPQGLYHLIKLFYVSRYIRKHEKQDTQLLLLCKKYNTYTQTFENQALRLIDSRKESLVRDDFYTYMNYQDAIGFTAAMYVVQHMRCNIRLSAILEILFTKGADTCPKDNNKKTALDHAEAFGLPAGIIAMIKEYRAKEDTAALMTQDSGSILSYEDWKNKSLYSQSSWPYDI